MKNTTLTVMLNSNSPSVAFLHVIEETEKAIKVQNVETKKEGWLPKKALKPVCTIKNCETFTFESWFRKIDDGKAITAALRLL